MIIKCCERRRRHVQCAEKIHKLLKSVWEQPQVSEWNEVQFLPARCNVPGKWLYDVAKGIGRMYSALKRSAGCSKVCRKDHARRSVGSGDMEIECGVEPQSATISLVKWGAFFSRHVEILSQYFSDISCEYIKQLIPANLPVNVMNKLNHKWM